MNISSAIVLTESSLQEEAIEGIKSVQGCEIAMVEENKLIITIEAEDTEGETGSKAHTLPKQNLSFISVRVILLFIES